MSQNGKGDKPRNCFSKKFRDNYDKINWTKEEDIKKLGKITVELYGKEMDIKSKKFNKWFKKEIEKEFEQ